MPKVAKHVLTWSPERNVYELRGLKGVNEQSYQGEDQQWFTWLSTLSSFSFQGQHGNLTLRKEARTSGEGYWYAYRSQHQRTVKRYAGRTAGLTISARASFPRVAWASLDSGDDDPVRFWLYVITACQVFQAGLRQSALALLAAVPQPPFEPTALEMVLTTFLNALTHLPSKGILVLEDYHVITSPHIHKMMLFFLDHLPTTLHLVIITRSEPPLQLVRLRARN